VAVNTTDFFEKYAETKTASNNIFTCIMLRSESSSCERAKLRAVVASSKIEITRRDHSIIACSHHLHMDAIPNAHPVRDELRMRRHSNRKSSTIAKRFRWPLFAYEIVSSCRKRFKSWQCKNCSESVHVLWYFPLARKKLIDRLFMKF